MTTLESEERWKIDGNIPYVLKKYIFQFQKNSHSHIMCSIVSIFHLFHVYFFYVSPESRESGMKKKLKWIDVKLIWVFSVT